jgi:hypothetical protein
MGNNESGNESGNENDIENADSQAILSRQDASLPGNLDSTILSELPALFPEFRDKRIWLLWRGSRDGFRARIFHRRCDGHANTLTVIEDTNGNIFGGFTPTKWELVLWNGKFYEESNSWKADRTGKSFLFTLKNPHNVGPRRFGLKSDRKHRAIECGFLCGPDFHDLGIYDFCTENTRSYTYQFNRSYENDTGLDSKTFFTGSPEFQAKEVEVFEITDAGAQGPRIVEVSPNPTNPGTVGWIR